MTASTPFLLAQSECSNRVPNGDFSQVVVSPWSMSGGAGTYVTHPVIGALPSRCVRIVPMANTSTLTQPTPLTLQQGERLEVAADFDSVFNFTVEFGFTPNGGARTVLGSQSVRIGRHRAALRYVPAATETGTFDLTFQTASVGSPFHLDNATIRTNELIVTFPNPRNSTGQASWKLLGQPNRNYGLFVAGGLQANPFRLSGCSGLVWLDASLFALAVGLTDQAGEATGSIPVTRPLQGHALYFQALDFPPCRLGCALTLGF